MALNEYDPNYGFGKHTIEVDLMMFGYRATVSREIGGNTKGKSVIDGAINSVCELIFNEGIKLLATDGSEMNCEAGEDDSSIEDMVVGVRIVNFVEEKPPNKKARAAQSK